MTAIICCIQIAIIALTLHFKILERTIHTAGCATREGRCCAVTSVHEFSISNVPNWTRNRKGKSGSVQSVL